MAEYVSNKKRLHSGQACEACRRRKSRCDALRPQCSNCRIRNIPCDYVVQSAASNVQDESPSKKRQSTRRSSVVNATSIASTFAKTSTATVMNPESCYADSSTFTFLSNGHPEDTGHAPLLQRSSSRNTRAGLIDGSTKGPDDATLEYYLDLPSRFVADALVDDYFGRVHLLYPFLHEGQFRREYENMWERPDRIGRNHRLSWYGVLNMIFAHGCESCREFMHEDPPVLAPPFVARVKAIILSQVFQSATLETVQALLMLCYYLQTTVDLEECWSMTGLMIRAATGLGLHTASNSKNSTPVDRELRKRAWWGCFVLDRTLSMKLGRPPSLQRDWSNVDLPLEVDDQYIISDGGTPRQPSGNPSMISFFVTTIKLSQIIYDMLTQLYLRGHERYNDNIDLKLDSAAHRCYHILSRVMLIDGQLQSWWDHAPRHLTQEQTKTEKGWHDFQRQRMVLRIRYLHVRLLLHRQSFLYFSQAQITNDLLHPVALAVTRTCVACARETIDLINTAYSDQRLYSLTFNAQYVFTSLGVLCILDRMPETKRALAGTQIDTDVPSDHYSRGMNLLKAASHSSSLAMRYISIIDHLRGSETIQSDERVDSVTSMVVSAPNTAVGDETGFILPPDPQAGLHTWTFDPMDSLFPAEFDFTEVEALLSGANPLEVPFSASMVSDGAATYVGW